MDDEVETVEVDSTETGNEDGAVETPKTYTEDELNSRVETAVNDAVANAISEGQRLASMSAEEKKQDELSKLEEQVAELTAQRTKLELESAVKGMLNDNGLPVDLTDSLVGIGNADSIKNVIGVLDSVIKGRVEEGVKEAIKQPTPKAKATLPENETDNTSWFDMIDNAAKGR